MYTFAGYNFMYGSHLKQFNDNDINIAHNIIRFYRQVFGSHSPHDSEISTS